ncbi:MAG: Uncharacterised protein [Cyanobium sp. ARS6]|nr:MAG: Uncharacterised protein [Cyanobium sp. ARS6]
MVQIAQQLPEKRFTTDALAQAALLQSFTKFNQGGKCGAVFS